MQMGMHMDENEDGEGGGVHLLSHLRGTAMKNNVMGRERFKTCRAGNAEPLFKLSLSWPPYPESPCCTGMCGRPFRESIGLPFMLPGIMWCVAIGPGIPGGGGGGGGGGCPWCM